MGIKLHSAAHHLIFSSFFVSIPVTAFLISTYFLCNLPVDGIYVCFVFSSTWFLYLFHRYIGLKLLKGIPDSKRFTWMKENHVTALLIMAGTVITSLILFLFLKNEQQMLMFLPWFISMAYTLPLFSFRKKLRLRDISFVKIFCVCGSVVIITTIIPLIEKHTSVFSILYENAFLITGNLFFVFAITLPFDIRDLEIDKRSNTLTIPLKFGVKITQGLMVMSVFLYVLFYSLWLNSQECGYIFIYVLASAVISLYIILNASIQKSEEYYALFCEGAMVIHALLIVLMVNHSSILGKLAELI